MILDTKNRRLAVVLDENKTTSDCDVSIAWLRGIREERVPGERLARTNGMTRVELLGPPDNGQWFDVQEITVVNVDTVTHKVRVQILDGAAVYTTHLASLSAGQNLTYNSVSGFVVN